MDDVLQSRKHTTDERLVAKIAFVGCALLVAIVNRLSTTEHQ